MAEVLKIKKVFSALNAEKIDQVNNIVKGTVKSKSKIQIKGLLESKSSSL